MGVRVICSICENGLFINKQGLCERSNCGERCAVCKQKTDEAN